MQRKLIVTLIAGALELVVASCAQAQVASCQTNAATPVRSGPLSPVDGFPEYVTDSNGVSVQRCLDARFCFFDPIVSTDPFSLQIGSGGEAFYWGATGLLEDTNKLSRLVVVMAAETAFTEADPQTGAPVDGSQFPFLRLRISFKPLAAGSYTLTYPYGTETFTVDQAGGGREIFDTIDRGFAPSSTFLGPVGPFLRWDNTAPAAPAGFLGDGNPDTGVTHPVSGSPCGTNFLRLTGRGANGLPLVLDPATGATVLTTNLFDVQGQLYDGRTQTPLMPTRLSYSRAPGSLGQIDAFATSTPTAAVTVQDGPTTPAAAARITAPVSLGRSSSAQGLGLDSASITVGGVNTDALPRVLSLSASDTNTDATTLNRPLVDLVVISQADYDPVSRTLIVQAASADQRVPPSLTLHGYGVAPGTPIVTAAPPAVVTVDSSAGGRASAQVRVLTAAAPGAPSGLAATANSPTQVSLAWVDNASTETGFHVERGGVVIASLPANAVSFVDTGVAQDTAYTYQVYAINSGGRVGSTSTSVVTPPQLNAPGGLAASAVSASSVTLRWVDNANNETGYQVLRNGTAIASLGANVVSYTDSTVAGSTTYSYQVVALHPRASAASAPLSVTTPVALPAAPTGLRTTAVASNSVALAWTDASANETGFQVLRNGAVIATLAANSTAYTDTTVAAATSYSYTVAALSGAGASASAPLAVTTPAAVALAAPTALTAAAGTTANSAVLRWTDASTGETAYRVQRATITIAANGTATTGAFAVPTAPTGNLAANAVTYTNTGLTAATLYAYQVNAVNGATQGPASQVNHYNGTLPAVAGLRSNVSAGLLGIGATPAGQVPLAWTASTVAAVAGYDIQRCVGATTVCTATSTNWVNVTTVAGRATAAYTVTGLPSGQLNQFRIRSSTGAAIGLVGAWSAAVAGTPR